VMPNEPIAPRMNQRHHRFADSIKTSFPVLKFHQYWGIIPRQYAFRTR
jgi:hypothetical protein